MMNRLLFIIFISYIFTNTHSQRCGFYDNIISPSTRIRPTLDTSIFSPSGHFQIHFDTLGNDAPLLDDTNNNNIPDYAEAVGIIADSTRKVLVDLMGYYSEPDDNDGIYDIYIEDRGSGSYGFTVFDDQNGESAGPSYMLIDDEYEEGDYHIPGINTMRLTVAHEFFHAIQRAYRPYPSGNTTFLYEMSSTWIEDVIVPDGDDYIYWVDNFFENPYIDIDDTDGYSIALFGHYLTQVIEQEENQMSSSIIREIWENFENINDGHSSINNVLTTYNSSFTESWTNFCARNLFNGKYTDMNNPVYYYIDQINTDPIETNPVLLNQNQNINDIIINDKSIAPIKSFTFDNFYTLEHYSSISDYYDLMLVDKYDNINIDIVDIDNIFSYNIFPNDKVHFLYSGYNNSELLDIEILLEECDINNPPQGFCDCNGNIIDECGICSGNNACFPSILNLSKTYPNPFNYILNIEYEIPSNTQVLISAYDINGKLIQIISNEIQKGREAPYSITWNTTKLSSGVYIINLLTNSNSVSKKVTLVK